MAFEKANIKIIIDNNSQLGTVIDNNYHLRIFLFENYYHVANK